MESSASDRQRAHYEAIHDAYDAHYGDPVATVYRRRFFIDPLLAGLALDGKDVADLASGSGYTTAELQRRFPRLRATGFDISEAACRAYTQRTGCPAVRCDLTGSGLPERAFDAAVIVGGLHHCIAALDSVLSNVATLLRPGGVFLMVEPSKDCWLEPARRWWYSRDGYFEASTEAALSHDELLRRCARRFRGEFVAYMGGPAYFLLYNSLVLRVPLAVKQRIASPLLFAEEWFNRLPGKMWFPYFVARWRKVT